MLARFHQSLSGLSGDDCGITSSDTARTRQHLNDLRAAATSNPLNRTEGCAGEIAYARDYIHYAPRITAPSGVDGTPLFVINSDTGNNHFTLPLFRPDFCMVNLETVMPGLALRALSSGHPASSAPWQNPFEDNDAFGITIPTRQVEILLDEIK